jgi:hypothetical protein
VVRVAAVIWTMKVSTDEQCRREMFLPTTVLLLVVVVFIVIIVVFIDAIVAVLVAAPVLVNALL